MKRWIFASNGRTVVGGPFASRKEAKAQVQGRQKVGYACRFCGHYSGGNTVCRDCICDILPRKEGDK